MDNGKYKSAMTCLTLALILAGISMYLNNKKNRELIALNESISKLTNPEMAPKKGLSALIQNNLERQQIPDEDVLTKERVYTEIELQEMNEAQFTELVKATELRLPKITDIKKIPAGALHHTPALVMQAGRDLGVIKEVLRIHESYERVALPFYKNCARNEEGATPVRALCLTNLIELNKKNNQPVNLSEYPSQLIELSKMVTDI